MTEELPQHLPGSWTPRAGARVVATKADVDAAAEDPETVLLDSREAEKFRGETVWFETGEVAAGPDGVAYTPRGALRAGHIPWARSMPWRQLYRDDLTMKSPDELRELFARLGATPGRRAITYCGVGISAAALLYALDRAGIEEAALYDAGWDEWGRNPELPVARG